MADHWTDRRVFLTGATGFIGRYLAEALIGRGATVTALVRPGTDASFLESLGVTVKRGNVADRASIDVGDARLVIHGAAWVGFGLTKKKNALMRRTNIDGTRNVIDAAREAGVNRFLQISSVAAVGATPAGLYAEDRLHPDARLPYFLSEYERTKWESQRLAMQAEEAGRMRSIQVLPGVVLGLGGGFERLMQAFYRNKLPRLPVGDAETGVVHVRDVVSGTIAAAEHGRGPYLLSEENVTTAGMIDMFAKAAGREPMTKTIPYGALKPVIWSLEAMYHLVGKTPPLSKEIYRSAMVPKTYDSTKAKKELGWAPDTLGHLEADFEALAEGRRPKAA